MFIRRKRNKSRIAYLLLWIFSIQFGYVLLKHSSHHHHEHTLHTQEEELNPCHRTIFHNDFSHGCDHRNHFGKADDDCTLCKYYNVNYIEFRFDLFSINYKFKLSRINYTDVSYNRPHLVTKARGPPNYMI